eukprot:jgi/Undpi1/5026/HiC_scaffold_19.g08378.m1
MGGVLAGGGGGGGQRAAGVTRAHHMSLRQLKIEKAKRRLNQQRKQQREEVRDQRLSPASTTEEQKEGEEKEEEEEGGASPGGFFSSPRGCASPGSASRAVAPSSSSSNGLRRAANMALSKNDLMSPTLKRLLQAPSKLQTLAATAATTSAIYGDQGETETTGSEHDRREITGGDRRNKEEATISDPEGGGSGKMVPVPAIGKVGVDLPVASPGSDESGLGDERGGSGGSSSSGDGGGGRVTPADLRRSMGDYGEVFEASPFSAKHSGGGGSRENHDDSFVSSCSESDSSSSGDEEQDENEAEQERGRGEGGGGGETDCSLPTRVLFAHDQSPPQQQGKAPASGTFPPRAIVAAAAAPASAAARKCAGFPALEMKCPPPRDPTKHASGPPVTPVGGGAQPPTSCREEETSKNGRRGAFSANSSSTSLTSPRALPYHVTPKRMGVLVGGKRGVGVGASSTVKRRVRFVMEERGGPLSSASLNSPCRANGNGLLPSVGGWWGRTGGGVSGGVVVRGDEGPRPRSWCRLLSLLVSVLAAIAIGVVVTAAFHDEQGNDGSFEMRRTSPVFSPVPPLSEAASAGNELPVAPSVAEESVGGGGEERQEEEGGAGVVSGENGDGVVLASTVLSSQLQSSGTVIDAVAGSRGQLEVAEDAKVEEEERKAQLEKKEEGEEGVCDFELAATNTLDCVDVASNPGTEKASLPRSTGSSDAYAAIPSVSSEDTDDASPSPDGNVGQHQVALEVDDGVLDGGKYETAATAGSEEFRGKAGGKKGGVVGDAIGEGIGEGGHTKTGVHTVPAVEAPKIVDPVAAGWSGVDGDDIRGEKESVQSVEEGVQRVEGIQEGDEGVLQRIEGVQSAKDIQSGEGVRGASLIQPTEIFPATATATAIDTAVPTAAAATFFSKWRWSEAAETASHSDWGLLEAGVAVFGALALWATAIFKSRPLDGDDEDSTAGSWNGGDGGDSMMGSWEGEGGGGAMSTPTGKGSGGGAGEGDGEFGSYSTVEMVKRGGTPATLRSVKRSRRISSSHKKPKSSMIVMDLGATALDLSKT